MVSFYNTSDLYNAVFNRNLSKARKCLKAKVSPDYCPILSPAKIMSLVSIAIVYNDEDMVRLLLEYGASVDGTPERAFVEAAFRAREKYSPKDVGNGVKTILGETMTITYAWETPLHIAAAQRLPNMVQILFDEGNADPNVLNSSKFTPLYFSLYKKDSVTTRLLVDRCALLQQPCASLDSAMEYAAEMGEWEVLAELITHGGSAHTLGPIAQTALYKAAAATSTKSLHRLIGDGLDIEAPSPTGMTAFFEAAANYQEDVMKRLLDVGASIDAKDTSGCTALHRAALAGHRHLAQFLLDNGADAEAQDDDGWSCLYAAMVGQKEPIAKLLIESSGISSLLGSSAGAQRFGTPLHQAASTGSVGVARHLLLGYGGTRRETIDALNREKETPLCLAAANGHRAVARLLLSRGADPNHSALDGRTPLWLAAERGSLAVVRDLVSHGARIGPDCVPSCLSSSNNEGHILVAQFIRPITPQVNIEAAPSRFGNQIDSCGADAKQDNAVYFKSLESSGNLLTEDQTRMLRKQGKPLPSEIKKGKEADAVSQVSSSKKSTVDAAKDKKTPTLPDPFEASIPDERSVTINKQYVTKKSDHMSTIVGGALQLIGGIVGTLL